MRDRVRNLGQLLEKKTPQVLLNEADGLLVQRSSPRRIKSPSPLY